MLSQAPAHTCTHLVYADCFSRVTVLDTKKFSRVIRPCRDGAQIKRPQSAPDLFKNAAVRSVAGEPEAAAPPLDSIPSPQRLVAVEKCALAPVLVYDHTPLPSVKHMHRDVQEGLEGHQRR